MLYSHQWGRGIKLITMTVETKENLGNDHPGLSSPDTIVHALYS